VVVGNPAKVPERSGAPLCQHKTRCRKVWRDQIPGRARNDADETPSSTVRAVPKMASSAPRLAQLRPAGSSTRLPRIGASSARANPPRALLAAGSADAGASAIRQRPTLLRAALAPVRHSSALPPAAARWNSSLVIGFTLCGPAGREQQIFRARVCLAIIARRSENVRTSHRRQLCASCRSQSTCLEK